MNKKEDAVINADLLPYFAVNENIAIFLNTGLKVTILNENDTNKLKDLKAKSWTYDPTVGFVLNPYVRVGAEWGPTFYAGFQLWTDGVKVYKGGDRTKPDPEKGDPILKWAVPVALQVSF